MEKKMRYNTLDLLRGVAVIAMIAYHLLWDLVNIFDVNIPWFGSGSARVIQQSIRRAFILISGFSWHLGKKKAQEVPYSFGCIGSYNSGYIYFYERCLDPFRRFESYRLGYASDNSSTQGFLQDFTIHWNCSEHGAFCALPQCDERIYRNRKSSDF